MDPSDEPPAKHARVAVDTDPPLHPAGHRLALPPGWLGCPNHGAALCRGLLLPCKVPLGAAFDGVLSGSRAGRRFRPADAVAAASAGGQRVVLAVVDLTKTLRYYDPSRELPHDVRHFKLPCEGSEAPAPQDAALFCAVLQSELDRWRRLPGDPASRPRPAFVVHCTHGFNRTGALCVHYLMRGERVWPDLPAALHEFAAARPPGIYKESYVASLFEYYREVRPAPPSCVCPATPAWKREEEEGPGPLAADDVPSGDLWGKDNPTYMAAGRGPPLGVPDERPPPSAPASATPKHDDPLGEEVPAWVASSVRGLCAQLCAPSQAAALAALAAAPCGPGPSSFPGSQPVSLSRANAGLLADPALRYLVSWKADGTRYLLLLMHAAAYLLDRAGRVRRCQMRFPTEERVPGKPHRRAHTHHWTLLDGEMVVDTPGGGEPPVRRFLVYDCCAIGGVLKTALPFKQRCDEAERQVVQAKAEYTRDSSVPFLRYRSDQEEFRLRRKPFFGVETTAQLLRSTLPSLTHASDGLVFQPGVEPYRPRTAERLLKWKFPSLNSVDFLYVLGGPGGHTPELQLQEQGGRARALRACALPPDMLAAAEDPRGAALVTDGAEEGEAQQLAPGCVVECAWRRGAALGDPGAWALLRVRRDKTHANHESVFAAVWRSIVDDIQEADLMALLRPAIEQRERRHAADAPGAGAGAGAGGGGGGEGGDGDTKPGAAGVAGGGARGAEGGDRDG